MTPEMTRWFQREDAHNAMRKSLEGIEKALEDFGAHLTNDEIRKLRSQHDALWTTIFRIGGDEG